jgi:hypothetical protein
VSRIHRRSPRGDWSLEFSAGSMVDVTALGNQNLVWTSAEPRYLLEVMVTQDQAYRLMGDPRRGGVSVASSVYSWPVYRARGIVVTPAEAHQIVQGTHPLDVLFPAWPCGYRLYAVPDPLVFG